MIESLSDRIQRSNLMYPGEVFQNPIKVIQQ